MRGLTLVDLPEDALQAVAAKLELLDRLRLSSTSRRLRDLCQGPSEMWRTVRFTVPKGKLRRQPREERAEAALQVAQAFAKWLSPRLSAVESLSFALQSSEPLRHSSQPWASLPALLLQAPAAAPSTQLPLRELTVQWPGTLALDFRQGPPLPNLRRLAFPSQTQLLVAHLAAPQLQEFELADGNVATVEPAWLPPTLTALCLAGAALRTLPPVLRHLPALRSLLLATNRLNGAPLDDLRLLAGTLQELNLSECYLTCFPREVSSLASLRILFLHNAFHRTADLAPADWDALRPLRRLAFLAISANQLAALPPAVGDMTHLQALHLEDNELAGGLPLSPCLANLSELLLDWQAALDSGPALRAAPRLSRLVFNNHRAADLDGQRGLAIRPAGAGEPLLAALAAMRALKAVESVLVGGEDIVTAPVAHVMWHLGSRCPHLRVGLLQDANVGWGLADLERADAEAGAVPARANNMCL